MINSSKTAPQVGTAIARSGAWTVLTRLVIRSIGFISTLILARILLPHDFGLVAMAMLVIGLIEASSEFGLDIPLINDKAPPKEKYDTAWTLSLLRGGVICLIMLFLAAPVSRFFEEPQLTSILMALSVTSLLNGVTNIGIVDWRKQLQFGKEFNLLASEKLVAFLVTLTLALILKSAWALVGGILAGKVWRVGYSYVMCGFRPGFSFRHAGEIFHFGKWVLLQNIFMYLQKRADVILIGRMLNASALGIYSLAFEISNMVTSELLAPIRRALLPGYAQIAENPPELRRVFLQTMALTTLIGTPIAVGMGVIAAPMVHILLGENWLGAIPLIQILSAYGVLSLLTSATGPVFLVLKKPQLLMVISLISLIFLVPMMILGIQHAGLVGAAWALVITQVIAVSIDLGLMLNLLKVNIKNIIHTLWRPAIAALIMGAAVSAVIHAIDDSGWQLICGILIGMVVYPLSIFCLWILANRPEGAEQTLIRLIGNRLSQRKSHKATHP